MAEPAVAHQVYNDVLAELLPVLKCKAGHEDHRLRVVAVDVKNRRLDHFCNYTAPGAYFVEIQNLPEPVLTYLLPSRYCESDKFGDLAREITAWSLPGYDQVASIDRWVRNTIRYTPGSSNYPISAVEVHARREGVCRDLAHLGIALCRSISIPTRLVVGYLDGLYPMDLHAWFEAYVGSRWYTFDPTQNEICGGRVAIAYGRDAADVSVFHQFGPGAILTSMEVRVERLEYAPD